MKLALAAILCAAAAAAGAQEYQGADAILKQIEDAAAKPPAAAPNGLHARIADFKKAVGSMNPRLAAQRWIQLATELPKANQGGMQFRGGNDGTATFHELFDTLPGPASWPELSRLTHSSKIQPEGYRLNLCLLTDFLTQDASSARADARLIAKHPEQENGGFGGNVLNRLASRLRDPVLTLQLLHASDAFNPKAARGSQVEIPDIVPVLGDAKSLPILTNLLFSTNRMVTASGGSRTTAMLRRIAKQNVAKLKAPQWPLASGPGQEELYVAMVKRFPKFPESVQSEEGQARLSAKTDYVLDLVARGRVGEAEKINEEKPLAIGNATNSYVDFQRVTRVGASAHLQRFLSDVLAKHPNAQFWDQYLSISQQEEQGEMPIALIRKGLQAPNLGARQRMGLQQQLWRALLADDRVDEGLTVLRGLKTGQTASIAADELIKLGSVLNRPELIDEGLAVGRGSDSVSAQYGEFESGDAVDSLIRAGRGSDAEKLLRDNLIRNAAIMARANPYGGYGGEIWLRSLAGLYWIANRPNDVLELLDHAPMWGIDDLIKLNDQQTLRGAPITFVAAWALASAGRNQEALPLVESAIRAAPNFDFSYELLIKLKGGDALRELDRFYAQDRFEERPLIWKAKLYQMSGRLDDAEKAARAAIAVDPSDGDQLYGQRLLAYAVLADVVEAKGDATQAAQLREAVHAIRIGEEGDRMAQAFLLKRGIAKYQEALHHFEDAYCLQSRLAVRLMQEGKATEAAEHYRKAYELMPSSFGRVETHCFGCEGVFQGQEAQTIAQSVFEGLEKKQPKNPQVHYLLGYLREEEERFGEAKNQFEEAVRLDPDYLNAWIHLDMASTQVGASDKEMHIIGTNLLRLDPRSRHATGEEELPDPAQLWAVALKVLADEPPKPDSLYRLKASAARMAEARSQFPAVWEGLDFYEGNFGFGGSLPRSPAGFLLRDSLIRDIVMGATQSAQMGFSGGDVVSSVESSQIVITH